MVVCLGNMHFVGLILLHNFGILSDRMLDEIGQGMKNFVGTLSRQNVGFLKPLALYHFRVYSTPQAVPKAMREYASKPHRYSVWA